MALTLQAVQDNLGVWIPEVQGKYINEDWNPENEGFGAQCWDLAANWSKRLGLPVINTGYRGKWVGWAGNMVSAYPQTPEIEAAYELIAPDQPGLPGDIAVWGDSYKEYYPATHVAVLIRDAGLQLLCASQNSTSSRMDNPYPKWSSGPASIQYLPRRGLIGFLRPRTSASINYQSSTITPLEDDVSAEEVLSWPVERTDGQKSRVVDELAKINPTQQDILAFLKGMNEKIDGLVEDAKYGSDYEQKVNDKVDEVVGNAQKIFWNSEESKILLQSATPAQLAIDINAAGIASDVRDELIKLLGGGN